MNQPFRPMCPEEIEAVALIAGIKFPGPCTHKELAKMLKQGLKMSPPSIRPNHVCQMWKMFPNYHAQYRGKVDRQKKRVAYLVSISEGVTSTNFRRAWRHLQNLAAFLAAPPEEQERLRQEALN